MPERTQGKMCTSMERVFRPLPNGFYREIFLHFINFMNEDRSVKSSKLDKEVLGGLYRVAGSDREVSQYGEVVYKFPNSEEPVRLLCVGRELSDYRYGRF